MYFRYRRPQITSFSSGSFYFLNSFSFQPNWTGLVLSGKTPHSFSFRRLTARLCLTNTGESLLRVRIFPVSVVSGYKLPPSLINNIHYYFVRSPLSSLKTSEIQDKLDPGFEFLGLFCRALPRRRSRKRGFWLRRLRHRKSSGVERERCEGGWEASTARKCQQANVTQRSGELVNYSLTLLLTKPYYFCLKLVQFLVIYTVSTNFSLMLLLNCWQTPFPGALSPPDARLLQQKYNDVLRQESLENFPLSHRSNKPDGPQKNLKCEWFFDNSGELFRSLSRSINWRQSRRWKKNILRKFWSEGWEKSRLR